MGKQKDIDEMVKNDIENVYKLLVKINDQLNDLDAEYFFYSKKLCYYLTGIERHSVYSDVAGEISKTFEKQHERIVRVLGGYRVAFITMINQIARVKKEKKNNDKIN
jgi:hypothetical protein